MLGSSSSQVMIAQRFDILLICFIYETILRLKNYSFFDVMLKSLVFLKPLNFRHLYEVNHYFIS